MKKVIVLALVTTILFGGLCVFEYLKFNDGKLHVVFCDVGQGDAIFIRTQNGKHVLIDGGPDRKVLNCLANHMPFWERTIDLMILTHPHADHFMGMYYVVERYNITHFATEKLENKSGEFKELMKMLGERRVPVQYVLSGDKWTISGDQEHDDVSLAVLGPTKEFLSKTSPTGNIGDSKEFASLVMDVKYGSFHAMLTGDTQSGELDEIANDMDLQDRKISILQSPHHGSRTGLNKEIVQKIDPGLVVISVGAFNRYKHPSKQTLELLNATKIPFLRTDQVGDIELVIDQKGWGMHKK